LSLIQRVRAEHGKHIVAHKFLAQVLDENVFLFDAEKQSFFARGREFLALSQIGGESHHLASVGGLQPLQNDRSVEAAGIGEHDFFNGLLGPAVGHWMTAALKNRRGL
jgi:hypothetical protein